MILVDSLNIRMRMEAKYAVSSSLRIGGGVHNFFTFNNVIDNRWELRPWQGATLVWPRWRVPLDHRLQDRWWRALMSLEFFAPLAGEQGQFREQARLSVGIERSFRLELRLRIELAWQKEGQALFIGGGPVNDLFFRFRIYQNWGR